MRKYGVLAIVLLILASLTTDADAKRKKGSLFKSTAKVSTGAALGRMTGSGAAAAPTEAAAPVAPVPVASAIPAVITSGAPVDKAFVKKNQSKEDHIASGILFLANDDYSKALGEFKKAQALGKDPILQRWLDIAVNKQKIKDLGLTDTTTSLP